MKGCVTLNSQVTQHNFPSSKTKALDFQVTELTNLYGQGRNKVHELRILVDALLNRSNSSATISVNTVFDDLKADRELQKECRHLCEEFPDIFKPELGTLKDRAGNQVQARGETGLSKAEICNCKKYLWHYNKTLPKLMKPESGKESGEKFNSMIMGLRWYLSGRTNHQVKGRHSYASVEIMLLR